MRSRPVSMYLAAKRGGLIIILYCAHDRLHALYRRRQAARFNRSIEFRDGHLSGSISESFDNTFLRLVAR